MFIQILIFPCKISNNPKDKDGYSIINSNKKKYREHRVVYENHFNILLKLETLVLHKCDNPPCIEPTHLFLGNQTDNIKDKVAKNRQTKGELHGRSILTEKEVLEIRYKYSKGYYTQQMLRREYHVSIGCIEGIIARRTWKHI